jgi:hypothetical protein
MYDMGSPEKMIRQIMQDHSIDRETAIMLALRSTEAALRVEGEFSEKKVQQILMDLLLTDSRNRTPWFVAFGESLNRKSLPGWVKLVDEATERGQDPVTAISVTQNVIMNIAKERVELVRLHKEGKSIEEITEASFGFDDDKTDAEMCELLAQQISL